MTERENTFDIKHLDGLQYLNSLKNNTIDLILTDPPYIISKKTGMNKLHKLINTDINKLKKTSEEWELYKAKHNIENDDKKNNYMNYGTIYGKKYAIKTDYGSWDSEFTMEQLNEYIKQFYNKLKYSGTLIMFFDLWKISYLKELLENNKFKQIRMIEWIKTNPQPRNSKINYLTNVREIALVCVKGRNPTFHSHYDKGIYYYPIQTTNRTHSTQKNLALFECLIQKHSNANDTVLDCFFGSGTSAIACKNTNRNFKGCEINKSYVDLLTKNIKIP